MNAARRLLVTQGIEHFTASGVADLAGVSKAAVYYYFAKNEEIVRALCEELAKEEARLIERATSGAESAIGALCSAVRAYVEHYTGNLDAFRILHVWPQAFGLQTASRALGEGFVGALATAIRRDQAEGKIAADLVPEHFALSAWASAHGLVSLAASHGLLALSGPLSLRATCLEITRCLQRAGATLPGARDRE